MQAAVLPRCNVVKMGTATSLHVSV